LNGSSLPYKEGNQLMMIGDAGSAANGVLLIDWVEVEYPRKLKLTTDSLYFQFKDLTESSLRMIKIENVNTPDFLLFKVKPDFQRVTAYSLVNGDLFFTDTIRSEDAFIYPAIIHEPIILNIKFLITRNQTIK
jgi:hypothetical protein